MKYFTKQLWSDLQDPGDVGVEASRRWDENSAAYVAELDSLRQRLAPDVFAFFRDADVHDVHDGSLVHLQIRDFDRLAPRDDHPFDGETEGNASDLGPWVGPYRVTVEMRIATSDRARGTEWTLGYAHIRRILVDFPTDTPLFFSPGDGFDDWGYHELSDAGDGFLKHEVLFASGAIVIVEFRTSPWNAPTARFLGPAADPPTPTHSRLGVGRWACLGSWSSEIGR